MRVVGLAFVSVVAALSVACSVTSNGDGSSGGSSGSSTTPTGDASTSGDSPTGGDGGPATTPPPSSKEADVVFDGTCSAFAACGGSPQGTYDYTAGCLTDAFAAAKAQCPTLDTTGADVKVKGSLHFLGPALSRDAVVTISGTIVVPSAGSAGQCATVETALKGAFDTVSCTGIAACTCTIYNTEIVKSSSTFTVAGNTVTTGDGESYEICATAASLKYSGKSLGSEDGHWELTKR